MNISIVAKSLAWALFLVFTITACDAYYNHVIYTEAIKAADRSGNIAPVPLPKGVFPRQSGGGRPAEISR